MSREIKFRAWDERANVMHNNFQFVKSGEQGNDWIIFVSDKQSLNGNRQWETNPFFQQQLKVMQFTGLTDRNGSDIYEGDIMRFDYFYASLGANMGVSESEHELTGIIEWGTYGWGLAAIHGEHWKGYTGYDNGEGSTNFIELMAMNEDSIHGESFEVIGNIHANPELLTSATND